MSAEQAQTTSFGWRIGDWAPVARDASLPTVPTHRAPSGEIAMAFQMFVFYLLLYVSCLLLLFLLLLLFAQLQVSPMKTNYNTFVWFNRNCFTVVKCCILINEV